MCGITGIYLFNTEKRELLNACIPATADLQKRGPDGAGNFSDSRVALGHRRLSILDVSNAAAQPFYSADKRYVLVYNGEIFNFAELRQKHFSDHHFRTGSDTEVLQLLLEKYAEKAIPLLNGFFAFAWYDTHSGTMLVARDRYGVKPLYYSIDKDYVCFASSLKSLMRYKKEKQISEEALRYYFHLNYIPAPYSIYSSVYKMMPGHYVWVSPDNKATPKAYYSLGEQKTTEVHDFSDAVNHVRELLTDAVSCRLVSDVPLGCFLSGGVDSSIVSAIASGLRPGIQTFSLGFSDNPFFDETAYANLVARHIGSQHHVIPVSNRDMLNTLDDFLDTLDEPFADSSALAVFLLSKYTRKEVTVSLSGDGADELFAGYNKHSALLSAMNPGWREQVVKLAGGFLRHAPRSRHSAMGNMFRKAHKYSRGLQLSQAQRYWQWAGFYPTNELNDLFCDSRGQQAYEDNHLKFLSAFSEHGTDFNTILQADFGLVLQGDMLTKVDVMSMANSLEVRTPFLDYRLVEYVFGLPHQYKIDAGRRKKILVEAFRPMLPQEIFSRPKKGFEIPLHNWFTNELKNKISGEWMELNFIKNQGIFRTEKTNEILQQVFSPNPDDATARTWAMIVFQHWWKHKHLSSH